MKVKNSVSLIIRWRSLVSISPMLLTVVANGQSAGPANADAKLLSSPPFVLSQDAIDAGINGTLLVAATLDSTGAVKSARVVAGIEWPCGKSPRKEIENVKELVISNIRQSRFHQRSKGGNLSVLRLD